MHGRWTQLLINYGDLALNGINSYYLTTTEDRGDWRTRLRSGARGFHGEPMLGYEENEGNIGN